MSMKAYLYTLLLSLVTFSASLIGISYELIPAGYGVLALLASIFVGAFMFGVGPINTSERD